MSDEHKWARDGPDWEDQWEALAYADWLEEQGKGEEALMARWVLHSGRWPAVNDDQILTYLSAWKPVNQRGALYRFSFTLPSPVFHTIRATQWYIGTSSPDCNALVQRLVTVPKDVAPPFMSDLIERVLLPLPETVLEDPRLTDLYRRRLLDRPPPVLQWPPAGYVPVGVLPPDDASRDDSRRRGGVLGGHAAGFRYRD